MNLFSIIKNALAFQRQAEGANHSANIFILIGICSCVVLLTACSENNLHFDTPNDAIGAYRGFLKEIEQNKATNSKDFCLSGCVPC